ncbi:MAG: chemotaxis protein CheA [bacterium]|nr:chemotaxis protein CheA [bacterium]MDT8365219.1 chemotaxis protein CheA [bacterium]
MDMSKYRDLFISEAREHVQGMSTCILVLEKEPASEQSINELFRHAHSVKGMSASMGYSKIAELSHHLEDMMDVVRKGQLTISSSVTDILLEGVDALENMVDGVEQDKNLEEADTSSLLLKVLNATQGTVEATAVKEERSDPDPKPESASLSAEVAGDRPEDVPDPDPEPGPGEVTLSLESHPDLEGALEVRFEIAPDSLVPAARAYLAVKKLESLGQLHRTDPSVEEIKAGNYTDHVTAWVGGVKKDEILKTLQSLAEMGQISVLDPDSEIAQPQKGVDEVSKPVEQVAVKSKKESGSPPGSAKSVRISTALLDTFINLVGELIVTQSRLNDLLTGSGSRDVDQVLTRVDHLISGLHSEVMKVRMMPLETVTQRLPRVVRDLALKRKKKVSLEVIGADIELDRAILEELGDPLIHILRNAVDHGLEETEGRGAAGKDATGRIVLRAFRERDMVYVEIIDDGRGIDLEAIKTKAVEKGLISRDQAKIISDEETVMLVCRPGFSTAAEVTDVSGRGVGMDVVQSTVDSLGGSLSIESHTGEGTTFTLRLPLTVAIVKMLLVSLLDHTFAVPITRVARTIRVAREDLNESQGRQYLNLDEELVSVFDLGELLKIERRTDGRSVFNVVLVEATNRTVGLVVDSVVGQVDIVVKPLCYPIQYLKRYSGMTVLGDGRIVPILDLGNLF